MNKSVLVIGVSGSGKSSLSQKLREMGYSAYDADSMDRLFSMRDRNTMKPIVDYDNGDIEKVKNMRWICNVDRLKQILVNETNALAFYCGTASNLDEIFPLFDIVILLKASPDIIRHRLSSRTTSDFAKKAEIQDHILTYKDWWEDEVVKKGAVVIDANRDLNAVASEVVGICCGINLTK